MNDKDISWNDIALRLDSILENIESGGMDIPEPTSVKDHYMQGVIDGYAVAKKRTSYLHDFRTLFEILQSIK